MSRDSDCIRAPVVVRVVVVLIAVYSSCCRGGLDLLLVPFRTLI